MQGKIVTPGRYQAWDTLRCETGEHALEGDAQGMHEIRLDGLNQVTIALPVKPQAQRSEVIAHFTKRRLETAHYTSKFSFG